MGICGLLIRVHDDMGQCFTALMCPSSEMMNSNSTATVESISEEQQKNTFKLSHMNQSPGHLVSDLYAWRGRSCDTTPPPPPPLAWRHHFAWCLLGIYLKGNKRKLLSLGTQIKRPKKRRPVASCMLGEGGAMMRLPGLATPLCLATSCRRYFSLMCSCVVLLKRGANYVVVHGVPLTGCLLLAMMLTLLVDWMRT